MSFKIIKEIDVYTDGACTLNNDNGVYSKGPGGWAYCFEDTVPPCNDKELFYGSYGLKETTNNECELLAILKGILAAKDRGYNNINVFSDSAYCINIFTQWAAGWERNGWTRGKKKEEIKNLELIKEIWDLVKQGGISFIKVKGHSGNPANEFVDKLAVAAKKRMEE